jgi:hypothetical protein
MTAVPPITRAEAVVSIVRDIARAALAGLIVGVVVLGGGGRVVMRLIAMLDPSSLGLLTENGNRIGDVTIAGTLALVLFGGIAVGLASSVVWVAIQDWIPGRGSRRVLIAMPIAVALTAFQLVRPENVDFRIVGPTPLVLAILLVHVAIAGAAFAAVAEWLDRRLPPAAGRLTPATVAYGVLVALGLPVVFLTARIYLESGFAVRDAPVPAGVAIVVTGLVTLLAWIQRVRFRRTTPSRVLRVAGTAALVVAVVVGVALLVVDVAEVMRSGR